MPFKIFGRFVELTLVSVAVGVVIGFLSAISYKKLRIITMNPIMECVILFCFAYISYCLSEVVECSGIISLLTCGVIMGHYTWYNLSPQSKQISAVTFSILGYAVEAFVFAYIGLTFFSYMDFAWSLELIIIETVVVFFGRFFATISIIKLFE